MKLPATLTLTIVALLAVPLAAADVNADRILMEGGVASTGEVLMVHLCGGPEPPALGRFDVVAQQMRILQYNLTSYAVSDGPSEELYEDQWVAPALAGDEPTMMKWEVGQSRLGLLGADSGYLVHVFERSGAPFSSDNSAVESKAIHDPVLLPLGIEPHDGRTYAKDEGAHGRFTNVVVPGDHVLARSSIAGHMLLEGDFTIEIIGVDLLLTSEDEKAVLDSGTSKQYVGPDADGAGLARLQSSLLYIEVRGGRLEIASGDDGGEAAWVTKGDATYAATGPVRMEKASGELPGAFALDGDDAVASGLELAVAAEGRQVRAAVKEAPSAVLQQTDPATFLPFILAGATLALLGAVIFLAPRLRRPSMRRHERLLERGRYEAAAREARRLLRREPHLEAAHIGRAVALSRAGRAHTVVHEVGMHLRGHEPSDGVLHYVLGMAYLDVGRADDGRQMLKEAARRTPALRPDVIARIGSDPVERPKEAGAYA